MTTQHAVASFRALHAEGRFLILANAWDAASARIFAAEGASAIATTSGGVAWTCGYPDGDALPRASLFFVVNAIRRVTADLPLTVDLEGGFSNDPPKVAELVVELMNAGVAGINIEDGADAPELLGRKITAIKHAVRERGSDIFINARTDVFLRGLASGDAAVRETISRAEQYAQAGADGIFVPRLSDPDAIRAVVAATTLPLNLIAIPGLPDVPALRTLGVRRLSAGTSLMQLALGTARRAAAAFITKGRTDVLFSRDAADYRELNAMFIPETMSD